MELSINQFIIHSIPESFLIIYVGLGLANIKTKSINYIKMTAIYTFFLVLTRNILNLYGFHTLILLMILFSLLKYFTPISWDIAIISALLDFIILYIGESLFFSLIFIPLNLSNIQDFYQFTNDNFILASFLIYLTKLPVIICALLIKFKNFNLLKLNFVKLSNNQSDGDNYGSNK
ncbi:MAG: hypothetical protein ACQEQI_08420 [Bacillota bacterium]